MVVSERCVATRRDHCDGPAKQETEPREIPSQGVHDAKDGKDATADHPANGHGPRSVESDARGSVRGLCNHSAVYFDTRIRALGAYPGPNLTWPTSELGSRFEGDGYPDPEIARGSLPVRRNANAQRRTRRFALSSWDRPGTAVVGNSSYERSAGERCCGKSLVPYWSRMRPPSIVATSLAWSHISWPEASSTLI